METNSTSKVFFLKVILSNAFIVGGKPVPFEPIPGNEGVIALDPKENNDLITALSNAAANQKGGVVRISEAEYTQKKTAAALKPSAPRIVMTALRVASEPVPAVVGTATAGTAGPS